MSGHKYTLEPLFIADCYARGKLFGIFSAKWLYLASVVLFEIGSALCGAAPNMNAFIVGRAIAGLGVCQLKSFRPAEQL